MAKVLHMPKTEFNYRVLKINKRKSIIILTIFSCESGAFLLVEATVHCRFYYKSKAEVIQTKNIVQLRRVPILAIE